MVDLVGSGVSGTDPVTVLINAGRDAFGRVSFTPFVISTSDYGHTKIVDLDRFARDA